jgi:hypothetical protein
MNLITDERIICLFILYANASKSPKWSISYMCHLINHGWHHVINILRFTSQNCQWCRQHCCI